MPLRQAIAAAMPAAWPMRQQVTIIRADDSTTRVAEKQRPATSTLSNPFTNKLPYGSW